MTVPMGYQWIRMILLAALCSRATQCMDKLPLGKGSGPDLGKSHISTAATAVSIEDVAKHPSGSVFRDGPVMKRPTVSQSDAEQYFKSIREFSQPSPGLSISHLDHIKASGNPYWSAVHINSLAEDFEIMSEDLDNLAKAIETRKLPQDGPWRPKDHEADKDRLARIAEALKTAHDFLKQYIERTLSHWASENNVPKSTIFSDKFLSLKKNGFLSHQASEDGLPRPNIFSDNFLYLKKCANTSGGQEKDLKISADTIKHTFPKECLESALSRLSAGFNYLDRDKDRDFRALHRIYIQTVDQTYKHNLLEPEEFEELIKANGYASVAARNMFLHFTDSAKDYKNPLFRNSDILLELWCSSPFVNMLKVIDDTPQKAEFLYEIIKADALDYIGTPRQGLVEKELVKPLKVLFEGQSLEGFERRILLENESQKCIQKIINFFLDNLVWEKEWGNNEALRLMAQTLKFIDENSLTLPGELQAESPNLSISALSAMFVEPLRNKINLFSARAQAMVELEKISVYLQKSFPLRNHGGLQKPISTTEELDLIKFHLENLPAQADYRKVIKGQDDGLAKWCKEEIDDKMNALRGEIDKIRRNPFGPGSSWNPGLLKMLTGKRKDKI
ncbi:hypothetical protein PSTG_07906 [Puccinia striiformis f. sp. tritici PST-78]|uniref:Uncharacterized protein n=1 Tax=Puccinia striiformis f. sp. tritici PST-78 TaxID=1165861 RepID=A0A0L0VHX2_9BASI|nr:hypothetical protein PSTG_07906 [Puccinia striiformis f. sp. tritici PST-78]